MWPERRGPVSKTPKASDNLTQVEKIADFAEFIQANRTTIIPLELPPEIWLHIAQYTPSDSLQRLRTLNRAFYDAATDDRYRRVRLCSYDPRTVRDMERIINADIARRVRVFQIAPFTVEGLGILESLLDHSRDSYSSKKHFMKRLLHLLRPGRLSSRTKIQKRRKPDSATRDTESMIRSLVKSIGGLSNVGEYDIFWGGEGPCPFDGLLLNAGWPVFGQNLQKLSISYPLDRLSGILPLSASLENLHELDIDCLSISDTNAVDRARLPETLAYFINRTVSIRSLRIRGFEQIVFEMTPFLRTLDFFPHLEKLHLRILCGQESDLLADPSVLAQFINRHCHTLQHLVLDLHPFARRPNFVSETLSRVVSTSLLSLELRIKIIAAESVLRCIEQFCSSLTSLALVPWSSGFEYNDVRLIAVAFVRRAPYERLTQLGIGVGAFRPDILNLLAENLPSLQKLHIIALNIFQGEIYAEARVYTEWKDLTNLCISRYDDPTSPWSLMLYLADHCIPSIRELDEEPMWLYCCRCAIAPLTLECLRKMLSEVTGTEREVDDAISARSRSGEYVCDEVTEPIDGVSCWESGVNLNFILS